MGDNELCFRATRLASTHDTHKKQVHNALTCALAIQVSDNSSSSLLSPDCAYLKSVCACASVLAQAR